MRTRDKQRAAGAGLLLVLWVILVSGYGEVAGLPTAGLPSVGPESPPAGTAYPLLLPTPTEDSYPWPTQPPLPTFTPSPSPGPPPIVLGAEWAPPEARETYASTTVMVAPVGDGPGEIGYLAPQVSEALPAKADKFTVDASGNIYILDFLNRRVAQFDREGRFVTNIVYGDAVDSAQDLAVDDAGRVYIYDAAYGAVSHGPTPQEVAPSVKLFDRQGNLLQEYPTPSWLADRHIRAMRVDEQGRLWVEGDSISYPHVPTIEGEHYPAVAVPLGSATNVLDEEGQKLLAVPGHLLDTGGTLIIHALYDPGPVYLYDAQGQRIYEVANEGGPLAVDRLGFWYLVERQTVESGAVVRILYKCDREGRKIASFYLPPLPRRVSDDGAVYCLLLDTQTRTAYYIIRWQQR